MVLTWRSRLKMEKINKTKRGLIITLILSIFIMFIIDYYVKPGYVPKSIVKIILFLILPLVFTAKDKNISNKDYFKIKNKRKLIKSLLLGIGVYIIILGAYFILKDFINLDNIKERLLESISVNKSNFVIISIYISFVNSLLEEFFFRGFIFLGLKKLGKRIYAHIISGLAFAIYHVAIMFNWFNWQLFIVAILGLFIGGILFNYLNEENENIYSSWLVHMFANFAINTVGFIMYGII